MCDGDAANPSGDDRTKNDDRILTKFSPSARVQLRTDVEFVRKCFLDRNRHGFLFVGGDSLDNLRRVMEGLSGRLSEGGPASPASMSDDVIRAAILERHA